MSRRAEVVAFLVCAGAACATGRVGTDKAPPAGPMAAGTDRGVLPDGDYACSLASGGYQYPEFHCRVASADGRITLEKRGGSQRFRGDVTLRDRGFVFAGLFYCPFGACDEEVTATFRTVDNGLYEGTFVTASGPIRVTLAFLPEGLEAASYGGAGSAGYGGLGYGGATYAAPADAPPADAPPHVD